MIIIILIINCKNKNNSLYIFKLIYKEKIISLYNKINYNHMIILL
jgi:hypothetical protein